MRARPFSGLAVAVAYGGGENIRDQMRMVEKGADIIVAAPGRLVDFMERGKVCVCMYVCMYVCMCIYMYIYILCRIYIYIYIYIYYVEWLRKVLATP